MANKIVQGSDGHYLLASHIIPSCLTYDISCTHMLSLSPPDPHTIPGPFTPPEIFPVPHTPPHSTEDASFLVNALIECNLVERAKVRASVKPEQCTRDAISSSFRSKALNTLENGLLIFAYHGLAVETAEGWSLVSSNFDLTSPATHITATIILKWIAETSVRPKKLLFFLDCPFASEIANTLVNSSLVADMESMCVFCANSPPGTTLVTHFLSRSLFSFFMAMMLRRNQRPPTNSTMRLIPIERVSVALKDCCSAVTSLCVTAGKDGSSQPEVVTVQVHSLVLRGEGYKNGEDDTNGMTSGGSEEVDGAVGRFDFIEKYYNMKSKQKSQLVESAYAWLNALKTSPTSPLHILHRHGALTDNEVELLVLRLVLYSTAMIQSNDAGTRLTIEEANFLIVLYVRVVGTVEHVTGREVRGTPEQFSLAVEGYYLSLQHRHARESKVRDLARKICRDNQ